MKEEKQDRQSRNTKEKANFVQGHTYACVASACACMAGESSNNWFLDSGASTHCTNDANLFQTLRPENSSILVGDNRQIPVTGKGTIKLHTVADNKLNTLLLKDVSLVPKLGMNLLSMARIEENGFKKIASNGKCDIIKEDNLVACAKRNQGNPFLYEIDCVKNLLLLRCCGEPASPTSFFLEDSF